MKYVMMVAAIFMSSCIGNANESKGTKLVADNEVNVAIMEHADSIHKFDANLEKAFKVAKTEKDKVGLRNDFCKFYMNLANDSDFNIQAYADAKTFEEMYKLSGGDVVTLNMAKSIGDGTRGMSTSILSALGQECNDLHHIYSTIHNYATNYVTNRAMHYSKYDRTDIATTIKFNEMLELAR